MPTVIRTQKSTKEKLPHVFFEIFPPPLYSELCALISEGVAVDEIRLRTGRRASVSSLGKNILLDYVCERAETDIIVDYICESSLYAHADTIGSGYVTLSGGIRVGIVGRASVCDGRIIGVYDISGLCFRIPRKIGNIGHPVCRLLRERGRGVLVYSPPGQGKTTLLRAVSAQMSGGEQPWRVVVIDSRGELGFALEDERLCVDVLVGYPRPLGIEIAARSMNAQLVVCDEIGTPEEAKAIIAAQNCGVPLLATAHAGTLEGLLRRTGISMLHEAGVFGAYVGIVRRSGERDYSYTVTEVEK